MPLHTHDIAAGHVASDSNIGIPGVLSIIHDLVRQGQPHSARLPAQAGLPGISCQAIAVLIATIEPKVMVKPEDSVLFNAGKDNAPSARLPEYVVGVRR